MYLIPKGGYENETLEMVIFMFMSISDWIDDFYFSCICTDKAQLLDLLPRTA